MMSIFDEMPVLQKDVLVYVEDQDGIEPEGYDIGYCWDDFRPRKSKWTLQIHGAVDNHTDALQVTHWCDLPPRT